MHNGDCGIDVGGKTHKWVLVIESKCVKIKNRPLLSRFGCFYANDEFGIIFILVRMVNTVYSLKELYVFINFKKNVSHIFKSKNKQPTIEIF